MLGTSMTSYLKKIATLICAVCLLELVTQSMGKRHHQRSSSRESKKEPPPIAEKYFNDSVAFTLVDFLRIKEERKYDMRIRPGSKTGEVTTVTMNIHVFDFEHIDELRWEYSINVYFRQRWLDQRLEFPGNLTKPLQLHYNSIDELWQPDCFFKNSRRAHGHDIAVPNRLIRVYPNGEVFYSQKLTLYPSCKMVYHSFPMDKQTCYLQIVSYAHTMEELVFQWKDVDGVTIEEDLELPQFDLKKDDLEHGACNSGYFTGSYACLYVKFALERKLGYYLSQIYIPSVLVVILSWVSFWLDVNAVAARISLGVLSILTLSTQNASVNQTLPKISYVKAIDVWMATCLCFTFSALLEFAVAHTLYRRSTGSVLSTAELPSPRSGSPKRNGSSGLSRGFSFASRASESDGGACQATCSMLPNDSCKRFKKVKPNKKLDVIARVTFPLIFAIFNIIYWFVYTQVSFNVDPKLGS